MNESKIELNFSKLDGSIDFIPRLSIYFSKGYL